MKRTILSALFLLIMAVMAQAQNITVRGTVLSATDDEPLIGASVLCPVTKAGAATDIDGNFEISVPENSILNVSYVGFIPTDIKAEANMTIRLKENNELLDEVVVVGYSSEKKADLTGSVSVVKMKDVADTPTGNVVQALQGRVAGMNIPTDGTPGGLSTGTSIRGASSFRGDANGPLYVIDGIMTRENPGTILNSNDVESIQVLKDAASASIYGAQAANGVIIITTKRAKKGECRVTFDATLTAQTYQSGLSMMNADQWGETYWTAYKYAYGTTPVSELYGNGATPVLQPYTNLNGVAVNPRNTNWEDEIHRTALMQTYSVGLSKGDENGSSSLSISYLDHDGIIKGTDFQKANTRFSSDYGFINNRLKVGGNLTLNWWRQHNAPGGIEESAIKMHPARTVYDAEGNYNDQVAFGLNDTPNLVRLINEEAANKHEYWRVFGNAYLSAEPVKNLILKTNFGINYHNGSDKNFTPANLRDKTNSLYQYSSKTVDWVWTNTAQYNIDFGRNSLMALVGIEAKHNHFEDMFGEGKGLEIEDPNYLYLGNVTSNKNTGSGASNYSMFSVFGKINYSWDNKYLASVTLRRDASSRFHPSHRWGNFWSVGAAWIVTKENFMSGTHGRLDMLKVKASIGSQGNDNIGNFRYTNTYTIENANGKVSTVFNAKGSENITWETNSNFNAGVEFSFLRGTVSGGVEYFLRKTTDMLLSFPVAPSLGYSSYYANVGDMRNSGVEIELNFTPIRREHVQWDINLNMTHLRNKITMLPSERRTKQVDGYSGYVSGSTFFGEGLPMYTFYMRKYAGVSDEGLSMWYMNETDDKGNPTGKRVTTTEYAKASDYLCGDPIPDLYGGFGTSVNFRGFDLSVAFTYQIGGLAYDSGYSAAMYSPANKTTGMNWHKDILNAWSADNASSNIPRLQYEDKDQNGMSDRFLTDASYLNLQNINFGYTLPSNFTKKVGIEKVRVYLACENVWYWSKRQGFDPRYSYSGSTSQATYSPVRTISGGINIQF